MKRWNVLCLALLALVTLVESLLITPLLVPTQMESIPVLDYLPWISKDDAALSDDVTANYSLVAPDHQSSRLKASGFNANLPVNCTVVGIMFKVKRSASSTSTYNQERAVWKGENSSPLDPVIVETWPQATALNGTMSTEWSPWYGGALDLWGLEWNAEDINDPSFGVSIRGFNNLPTSLYVDAFEVQISYSTGTSITSPSAAPTETEGSRGSITIGPPVGTDGPEDSSLPSEDVPSSPVVVIVVLTITGVSTCIAAFACLFILKRRAKNNEASELALTDSTYLIDVTVGHKLGGGKFGEVFKGKYQGADVALKKLKDSGNAEEFNAEVNALKSLHHPNIVRYLGIFKSDSDIYIVTEFLDGGSLDELLQKNKLTSSMDQLIDMAVQVASGMKHLHQKMMVHRDLACRNLLATINKNGHYTIKVGDFGLSRVLVKEDFYQIQNSAFPVKWSAPEVIQFGKCSTKSDVWAFGVTLWEIFSFGAFPYQGYSNKEASEKVAEGYRMPMPDNCPPEVYQLMLSCWKVDPEERPSFDGIYATLCNMSVSNIEQASPSTVDKSSEEDNYLS